MRPWDRRPPARWPPLSCSSDWSTGAQRVRRERVPEMWGGASFRRIVGILSPVAPSATAERVDLPKGSRLLCSNCEERPKAVVLREGRRRRLKLCKECIRELRSAPAAPAAVVIENVSGHESEAEQESPKCGARKRNGTLCSAGAGKGTDHPGFGRCKHHGGCTPTQRVGAARQEAAAVAVKLGAPINIAPLDALLWCVRIAAGEVAYFTMQVSLLEQSDIAGRTQQVKERPLSHGKDGESESTTVTETTWGLPALHVWVAARQAALDRLARYSKMALEAGVAERQVQLAERYGELIGRIIGNILDGLTLNEEQQAKAPDLVRKHLAAIEGTVAA